MAIGLPLRIEGGRLAGNADVLEQQRHDLGVPGALDRALELVGIHGLGLFWRPRMLRASLVRFAAQVAFSTLFFRAFSFLMGVSDGTGSIRSSTLRSEEHTSELQSRPHL